MQKIADKSFFTPLDDIEKGQYYLEQAKQKIMEALKDEDLNNILVHAETKLEDDVNKDKVE